MIHLALTVASALFLGYVGFVALGVVASFPRFFAFAGGGALLAAFLIFRPAAPTAAERQCARHVSEQSLTDVEAAGGFDSVRVAQACALRVSQR